MTESYVNIPTAGYNIIIKMPKNILVVNTIVNTQNVTVFIGTKQNICSIA